jgi:hypothetical protein
LYPGSSLHDPITISGDHRAAIEATNGWPSSIEVWGEHPEWQWTWVITNGAYHVRTNVAPFGYWFASYANEYLCWVDYVANSPYESWWLNRFTTNAYTQHSATWTNYASPLVAQSAGEIARTLEYWPLSNGVPVMVYTTNVSAGTHSATSSILRCDPPAIPSGFGFHFFTAGQDSYGGGGGVGGLQAENWWYLVATNSTAWPSSYSTSAVVSPYQANKTLERWEFEYK